MAINPTFTTKALVGSATAGSPVRDQITVAGTHGADGTLQGQLIGPVKPGADGACTSVTAEQWKAADIPAATTTKFAGDGIYQTNDVTASSPGCYTWVQTLTLTTPQGFTATSTAGEPSETFLLRAKITSGLFDGFNDDPRVLVFGGGALLIVGAATAAALLVNRRLRRRGRRYVS